MKKACGCCGRIHGRGEECSQKPVRILPGKSRNRREDIFRSSQAWKNKREDINSRDRYMCRACYAGLAGTVRRVNPYELSVHHVRSLHDAWELRLFDGNLVTLCRYHHEAAESGRLPAGELLKILPEYPPGGEEEGTS